MHSPHPERPFQSYLVSWMEAELSRRETEYLDDRERAHRHAMLFYGIEALAPGYADACDALGIESRTIDISGAVDAYLENEPDADASRRGNVMARLRMIALFALSARHRAIPPGTVLK